MGTSDSRHTARTRRKERSDGWTPARQLRFLQVLGRTRSVSKAAAAVGMSRAGAHRLRVRLRGELFALTWDAVVGPPVQQTRSKLVERHIATIRRSLGAEGANFRINAPHCQNGDLKERASYPSPRRAFSGNRA